MARPWLLVLSWTGYLAGAAIGAGLLHVMDVPLIVPALLLVLVVFL